MPARSALLALAAAAQACPASAATLDARRTLSRAEARRVYDGFARRGHIGGRDASGGYGGPAVEALLSMAAFADAESCVEFGCGQAKLANLVLAEHPSLRWSAVDQSPEMVALARAAMRPHGRRFAVALTGGEPEAAAVPQRVDRFVSTYVLDLLSERDMRGLLGRGRAHSLSLRPEEQSRHRCMAHPATARAFPLSAPWPARARGAASCRRPPRPASSPPASACRAARRAPRATAPPALAYKEVPRSLRQ